MLEKTREKTSGASAHPFDRATETMTIDGRLRGTASEDYWAFVGPFGGATGATLLRAMQEHPDRAGDPLTVTVNFCAPLTKGEFEVDVRLMRATRSTQHWMAELTQGDGGVVAFATAVFATRRASWSHQQTTMPAAPPSGEIAPLVSAGIANWAQQYQFRFVEGTPDYNGETRRENPASAFSKMWLSDATPRTIDFLSLLSMSDTFFARIFHVLGVIVPIGTVSMTTAFHADAADLAAEDTTKVLGVADANIFHKSFSDQTGQLWAPSGRLLATTTQTCYFKA
jgi:acyl-CoA thioesterase